MGKWKKKKAPQNIYDKLSNATHILWIIYVLLKVLCTSNPTDIFHFYFSLFGQGEEREREVCVIKLEKTFSSTFLQMYIYHPSSSWRFNLQRYKQIDCTNLEPILNSIHNDNVMFSCFFLWAEVMGEVYSKTLN